MIFLRLLSKIKDLCVVFHRSGCMTLVEFVVVMDKVVVPTLCVTCRPMERLQFDMISFGKVVFL